MRTSFLMGGEKLFSLPHWYKYTVSPLHKTFYISNFQRCEHAQRKDKGRKGEEEVTEEPRWFTMHEMAREFSLFEEALFIFEAQDPKLRMVHEGYNNHSKCNPVPPPLPRYHWIVLSSGKIELNPARKRTCAINVRCEWNCSCLPSIVDDPSALHLPSPLLPPVKNSSFLFTQCQLLYYKIKNVIFIFLFLCIIKCEKYYRPITIEYYIAKWVSQIPRLTLLDFWTKWT